MNTNLPDDEEQSSRILQGPISLYPKSWSYRNSKIAGIKPANSAPTGRPTYSVVGVGPNTAAMGVSYIHDPANWVGYDPLTVDQSVRAATEEDIRLVEAAAASYKPDLEDFLRRHKGKSPVAKLIAFLTSPAVNFATGKEHFANHPDVHRNLQDAVRQSRPVSIVTPAFAKIGAWPKLMDAHHPTAAEEISLRHLAQLGQMSTSFYAPGIEFIELSDSDLYNPYLGNPSPVVACYRHSLGEIIEKHKLAPFVQIVNYHEILRNHSHNFNRIFNEAHQQYCEQPDAFFGDGERAAVFQSLHASLCLTHLPMTYADYKDIFGPEPDPTNQYYAISMDSAEKALACKMAIRSACRTLETKVFEEYFPGAMRGTIHKVRHPNRPVIGQRIYPSYYRDSMLLPYHGSAYIRRDGAHVRAKVFPEIRLRSNPRLIRVTHHSRDTYFYTPADPDWPTDTQGLPLPC